ncbi:hypothetical protein [Streptomyces sp. SYSU K21746]
MTTAEALAHLATVRENADGPLAEVLDYLAAEIRRTDDPAAVADRFIYLTARP